MNFQPGLLARARGIFSKRQDDYRDTFDGVKGARVLADLFHVCHMGRALPGATEWHRGVAEGKRQVYLHLVSMIRADEEALWSAAERHVKEMEPE